MAVSIREVAARAGVSRGTVSSVLNERTEARIGSQTQERVRRVAQEMGYRPNRLARSLGRRRTDTIGLMIGGLRNPFFLDLMETAEELALAAGYDVLADTAFGLRDPALQASKLAGWPVDGILMWATGDLTLRHFLGGQADGVPVVYLGYPRNDGTSFVALDGYAGARAALEHLAQRGRKHIAYLSRGGSQSGRAGEARQRAYEDVCRERALPTRFLQMQQPEQVVPATQEGWREGGVATGVALAALPAASRPDAVFCHNDAMALGLYHGLRRGGMRVPEDVAVVGFDGISEGLCLDKPLTTVVSPVREMCETALALLTGSPDAAPRQIVLPTLLRLGETT